VVLFGSSVCVMVRLVLSVVVVRLVSSWVMLLMMFVGCGVVRLCLVMVSSWWW